MRSAKLLLCGALLASSLAACGSTSRPLAGSAAAISGHGVRGRVDDPRASHFSCLLQQHITAIKVGQTAIQVGAPPSGPLITFTPTPGAAQAKQINGEAEGAEVIGSALLYPNQGSDAELQAIENCVAKKVKG